MQTTTRKAYPTDLTDEQRAVLEGERFQEDVAEEVGEEDTGAGLGTVASDDAEAGRSDGLDARGELSGRFLDEKRLTGLGNALGAGTGTSHGNHAFRERRKKLLPLPSKGGRRAGFSFTNRTKTISL